jgi:signal transduction histidine kinase
MTAGLTSIVSVDVMTYAFRRFAHTFGFILLTAAAIQVASLQAAHPESHVWLAIAALAVIFVGLAVVDRWPSVLGSALFLVLGSAAVVAVAILLISQTDAETDDVLFSYIVGVFVFVAGPGASTLAGIAWCAAGYLTAEVGLAIGATIAGQPPFPDVVSTVLGIGTIAVVLMLGASRAIMRRTHARVARAAREERASHLRERREAGVAALIHDTVLRELEAIAEATPGQVDAALAEAISRDLIGLKARDWAEKPDTTAGVRRAPLFADSAIRAAIHRASRRSLRVEISGDAADLARLSHERDSAVGAAVEQCLENVRRHSGAPSAEMLIIGSATDVSIIIIDSGIGFDVTTVAPDRMGIRQSIRGRIEAVGGQVRVWSARDRGTSVMISVPVDAASPDDPGRAHVES